MKKILLGILISLFFTSCKKVITEVPYSFLTAENFPTSALEADAALVSIYSPLKSFSCWNYTGGLYMNTQNDVARDFSGWGSFEEPVHGGEEGWWTSVWQGINTSNDIIKALGLRDSVIDEWVPAKLGEARAMRAYLYHNLACLFGDLPLRLKPTNETVLIVPRSPVQSIYDSIILPDLAYADNKLPIESNAGGRLSSGGVKAVMVDVYMKLAGWRRSSQGTMIAGDPKYWALARDKAAEILTMENSGIYQLDPSYSQLFTDLSTDVYNKEIIFALEFTKGRGLGSTFPYIYGAQGSGPELGGGNANLQPIREWLRQRDTLDQRYGWNIAQYKFVYDWTHIPVSDTGSFGISTFQKIYPSTAYFGDHLTDWPLYRLSEIKLLYAEAANEANGGPSPEAYNQINQVRLRARPADHKLDGTILPDLFGLTQAQFREAIMEERAMEFICEGKRRLDLIRWGNLKQKVEAHESQLSRITTAGGFNDRFYLWSVPISDLTTNSWQNNEGF